MAEKELFKVSRKGRMSKAIAERIIKDYVKSVKVLLDEDVKSAKARYHKESIAVYTELAVSLTAIYYGANASKFLQGEIQKATTEDNTITILDTRMAANIWDKNQKQYKLEFGKFIPEVSRNDIFDFGNYLFDKESVTFDVEEYPNLIDALNELEAARKARNIDTSRLVDEVRTFSTIKDFINSELGKFYSNVYDLV